MKKNVVIESTNMNLVTVCERAHECRMGANQAVTMGKMGCDVTMPGMVEKFVGELKEAVWEKQ